MFGVIADDLTGALDAALLLHAGGTRAPVIVGVDAFLRGGRHPSTVILDVDSRGDSPETAYEKVRQATRVLLDAGYSRLYKKMSSTFQGHIGAEVDALMDECGAEFAIVVPAFPANGRTTRNGILYVDGVPLAETGIGRHPTSPITDSFLPRVLQAQTKRRVGLIGFETVQEGAQMLLAEFRRIAGEVQMAIVDVTSEADLEAVAEAARSLSASSGGSALAGKLPLPVDRDQTRTTAVLPRATEGCLLLAGSVSPVTAAQVSHAMAAGMESLILDAVAALEPVGREREVSRATSFAVDRIKTNLDVLVSTPSSAEAQAETAERARELGMSQFDSGMAIAGCLSEVAARVMEATGLNRLIVAGGDTSSAICRRLGLEVHEVLEEVQTGVPLSLSTGSQAVITALKSGNFGTRDFFAQALARMKSSG